jgi:hypothetical protein
MKTTTKTGSCGKCSGKGSINAFSGIANGVCFQCGGVGKVKYASRTGKWTRELVIKHLDEWFTNPVMVRNWGNDACTVIADLICRAPADVAARALKAAPAKLPADVAKEVARLCSFWRAQYEARGETLEEVK